MAELRYTKNGEWVRFDGTCWTVGLTTPVVNDLGDVTFVELPSIGRCIVAGEAVCALEAVKAAADYYAPVGGRIVSVNSQLVSEPQLLNTSPENTAWIFALEEVSSEEWGALMNGEQWKDWEAGR